MADVRTPAEERLDWLEQQGVPAEYALLLADALDALHHYRTRVHTPADEGWNAVNTWVADDIMRLADSVLARAGRRLRAWWRPW